MILAYSGTFKGKRFSSISIAWLRYILLSLSSVNVFRTKWVEINSYDIIEAVSQAENWWDLKVKWSINKSVEISTTHSHPPRRFNLFLVSFRARESFSMCWTKNKLLLNVTQKRDQKLDLSSGGLILYEMKYEPPVFKLVLKINLICMFSPRFTFKTE